MSYSLSVKWREVCAALLLLALNLSLITRPAHAQFAQFVPTKTSELTNDAGFITSAGVPTVLSAFTNDAGFITSAGAPVQSVAGLTGAISASGLKAALAIAQSDVTGLTTALAGKQATITLGTTSQYFRGDLSLATFPTALSAFTNDAGFITSAGAPVQSVAGLTGAISASGLKTALAIAQSDVSGLTSALAGKQATLVPTAVKTSAYTAAVNDFVPVDASGGSVTITLPNAPADGARVGIKLIAVSGANTCTIALQGSDVLNKTGGNASGTLKLLNHGAILQYKASGAIWYVTGEDLPLSQTDLRYAQLANNGSDFIPATFRTNLGATTVGANLFTLANPSAISFAKINADNSVTAENPSAHRASIGLAIGTNVEAWDTDLDSWAAITRATGFDTFAATSSSANFASLLTDEISAGTSPKVIFGDQAVATTSSPSLTALTISGGTITGATTTNITTGGASSSNIALTARDSSFKVTDGGSGFNFTFASGIHANFGTSGFRFGSDQLFGFVGNTTATSALLDVASERVGAGIWGIDGGTAAKFGQLQAGTVALQSIPTPAASPSAAVAGTAGTTTISYSYTDCQADVSCTAASPVVTVTTANATLSAGNKVTLTFPALGANTTYRNVYRTATNGTSPTTTGKINASNVTATTFDDTGLAGDSSVAPTTNATGTITGKVVLPNGSTSAPQLGFTTGASGFYRSSAVGGNGFGWTDTASAVPDFTLRGSDGRSFTLYPDASGMAINGGNLAIQNGSNPQARFTNSNAATVYGALSAQSVGIFEFNGGTAGKFGQLQAGTIALQSIPTPAASPSAAVAGTAGTTTISYSYTDCQADVSCTAASPVVTVTTANATLSAGNKVTLTFPALGANTTYRNVYRTATNGTSPTTTGKINASNVTATTFDDTGLAASGSAPTINATGAINTTKALGTTTNDSAQTGYAGEYVSSTVATGSSVSLTTNTAANVTSVSLTAGDWDVDGNVDYTFAATTSYTILQQGISTTSATTGAQDQFTQHVTPAQVPTAAADPAWSTPTVRISISGTTTVYLVAKATFTVSTLKAYGTLRARRVR